MPKACISPLYRYRGAWFLINLPKIPKKVLKCAILALFKVNPLKIRENTLKMINLDHN